MDGAGRGPICNEGVIGFDGGECHEKKASHRTSDDRVLSLKTVVLHTPSDESFEERVMARSSRGNVSIKAFGSGVSHIHAVFILLCISTKPK